MRRMVRKQYIAYKEDLPTSQVWSCQLEHGIPCLALPHFQFVCSRPTWVKARNFPFQILPAAILSSSQASTPSGSLWLDRKAPVHKHQVTRFQKNAMVFALRFAALHWTSHAFLLCHTQSFGSSRRRYKPAAVKKSQLLN